LRRKRAIWTCCSGGEEKAGEDLSVMVVERETMSEGEDDAE